jgi:hypothetical protein
MIKRYKPWLRVPLLNLLLLVCALAHNGSNPLAIEAATATLPSFIEPSATTLTFPINGGSAIGLAKGDFDLDGNLDLAVTQTTNGASPGPGYVSILLGNGDGTFRTPNNIPVPYDPNLGGIARGIIAKDFDRDGSFDLIVDVAEQRKMLFFKGRTDGTFNSPVGFNTIDRPTEV